MKKLLIFDASNYMFRAFFASPPMSNSAGFPTNALHFYTSMILSVIRRVSPDAIALAHDRKGPKFRHVLYPEYKGQRTEPPELLQLQFPWFRQITDAMGIHAYDVESYEADDVIATLTRQARAAGWHVVIASSDKDLMQLIERTDGVDTVVMLDAMAKAGDQKYRAVTVDDVVARFNVMPDKVADVLALSGDTIDNIPGCKGIGEKTAGKLIAEFGSLENLMQNLDKIKKPAQHANLEAFSTSAELSKKLTSLVNDLPIELVYEGMKPDASKVTEIFSALELHKLLMEILGPEARPDASVRRIKVPGAEAKGQDEKPGVPVQRSLFPTEVHEEKGGSSERVKVGMPSAAGASPHGSVELIRPITRVRICETAQELGAFLERVSGQMVAVVPLWLEESRSHRQMLGCSFADASEAVYVHLYHERSLFNNSAQAEDMESLVRACLEDVRQPKAVYGMKPIVQYGLVYGKSIDVSSYFDVEMAAYLVHPERTEFSLSVCSVEYLGEPMEMTPENWLGVGKKAVKAQTVSVQTASACAGLWAQIILQLSEKLPQELSYYGLSQVYSELDHRLSPILAKMEYDGVKIDTEALHEMSEGFDSELERLNEEVHGFSEEDFNVNSPKDLARFLFEVLKLEPATKKNRSHGLSTDQDTLESIDHPIAGLILEYRTISKLRSTYSESLATLADSQTHRIHGQFNACVTATTRLSSSDPNLQNIPGRTELGRRIKRTFVPEPGHVFISADYSQIELRLMAAFSKEPSLCEAYHRGEDVHARTAASLFDKPIEDVTKQERQLAKTINFGLLYGMGVQKLSRETGYSKADAKKFLEKFHSQFPTLSEFFTGQVEKARESGETRTVLGHRRSMPELYSERGMIKAFGERVALNAPIQGSASDIVKRAMIRFDEAIRQKGCQARLLIQVHDELLVECPEAEVEAVSEILRESMEGAVEIGVPLKVELKVGCNWADMNSPGSL